MSVMDRVSGEIGIMDEVGLECCACDPVGGIDLSDRGL